MKRRLKLKINGESPRSIFLAFVLAKLKCDIYLNDFSIKANSRKDYQLFLFSNFSKNLLIKFDIWNEIENISYGFNSFSIKDNLVSENFLLRTENFSNPYLNKIGWTANYSDIKSLFINKLINYDNVHFISKNQSIQETSIFDYEFNFTSFHKIINLSKLSLSTCKKTDEQILIFNVHLRGHIEKRLYLINTTKGLLILTPLNKNLYQIIWKNITFKIKKTNISSKSFFLDNLTTLLPNEFKVDQIIGDINLLSVNKTFSSFLIKNQSIYLNEDKFKSNILYDFNFDIIIRNIIQIYNYLEKNEYINLNILKKSGFDYLLVKFIEIVINFSYFNFIFNSFKYNNKFILFFRKLLFNLLKRINLLKIIFMSNFNNSNINNLNK